MSAAPSNLRPYTVTEERHRKGLGYADWSTYRILCGERVIHVENQCGPSNSNKIATLLNDAYEAGVRSASDYESTLPPDTPERRAFMAKWAAERCVLSPIPITPKTVIPFPCWIYWSGAIGPRWSRQLDYLTREELEALAATHYLPDQPDMPSQVP